MAFEVHDSIEIYDFKTLRKLSRISFKWPTSINFSPNGKYLASGDATAFDDAGGLVRVWSVPEPQKTLPKTINVEDLEKEAQILSSNGEFNPKDIKDARARIIRSVVQRQGQPEFRSKLLKAYEGRCPVTDCDQVSAIEASHIVPYKGTETNNPTNGLPLRADIHTLFDLHLFSINPDTYSLEIASALYGTCYHDLANRKLALPKDPKFLPSREALGEHYSVFLNRRAD